MGRPVGMMCVIGRPVGMIYVMGSPVGMVSLWAGQFSGVRYGQASLDYVHPGDILSQTVSKMASGEPCNCTSYRSSDFGFHRLDRLTARALWTQIFFSLIWSLDL